MREGFATGIRSPGQIVLALLIVSVPPVTELLGNRAELAPALLAGLLSLLQQLGAVRLTLLPQVATHRAEGNEKEQAGENGVEGLHRFKG